MLAANFTSCILPFQLLFNWNCNSFRVLRHETNILLCKALSFLIADKFIELNDETNIKQNLTTNATQDNIKCRVKINPTLNYILNGFRLMDSHFNVINEK